ncbi:HAD family hydrolase [Burkholderia arboris]|uniref:HAD family hydrolase n=1 Tax=Burkholderia arboris TaxID=488730 RepID=UPI001CA42A34|nr:HAD family hydrolase [Burkholderia arboris]MBY8607869.1 HAD family hydrolase [Burkholderia arboris]
MKTEHILVLDIDGTLTDSVALHQSAFLAAMLALKLPELDTDWGGYPHHTDTGILAHALSSNGRSPMSASEVAAFEQEVDRHFVAALSRQALKEIPGAGRFVREAMASGWGIVFATGGIRRVSERKLQAVGIPFDVDLLVTSSVYPSRTDLVAAAVERARRCYGITSSCRTVSVGDGLWDLEVAGSLGLEFIGIGRPPKADVLTTRGAVVFPDFDDGRLARLLGIATAG